METRTTGSRASRRIHKLPYKNKIMLPR